MQREPKTTKVTFEIIDWDEQGNPCDFDVVEHRECGEPITYQVESLVDAVDLLPEDWGDCTLWEQVRTEEDILTAETSETLQG